MSHIEIDCESGNSTTPAIDSEDALYESLRRLGAQPYSEHEHCLRMRSTTVPGTFCTEHLMNVLPRPETE